MMVYDEVAHFSASQQRAIEYEKAVVRLMTACDVSRDEAVERIELAISAYREHGEELDFDQITEGLLVTAAFQADSDEPTDEWDGRAEGGAASSMCTSRHPITRERCKFSIDQHSIKGHTDGVIAWPIQPNRDGRMAWALHSGKNRAARRARASSARAHKFGVER